MIQNDSPAAASYLLHRTVRDSPDLAVSGEGLWLTLEDGRKINQALTRGSYGAEAARLWAVLRTGINDLARAYGVPPLGV